MLSIDINIDDLVWPSTAISSNSNFRRISRISQIMKDNNI